MTTFSTTKKSEAVVAASRQEIWDVLTNPDLLAELTPLLTGIVADGDTWTWSMTKIPVLSTAVAPTFTEKMVFTDLERIEFTHAPPAGVEEEAGAEGWYELRDAGRKDGSEGPATHLAISLTLAVDLPLPKVAGPAVKTAMKGVLTTMGSKFATNLDRHLEAQPGA